MGDCISASICVVNIFSKWLFARWSSIQNLPENLASLEKAMEELKAKRDDVRQKVEIEEQGSDRLQRTNEVKLWLKRVRKVEKEFKDLSSKKSVELGRFILCGLCSKNLISSYQYEESVCKMLKEVAHLMSKGSFKVVVGPTTTSTWVERPLDPNIVGQEKLLAAVWQKLNTDEVGIMGLYGMGGVGKTVLLEQINNKFSSSKSSNELLVWVSVSMNITVDKIQDEISKILGLYEEEKWKQKTVSEKAIIIYNFMKNKKFFLLLDDIWEKVDLKKIGVPHPTRENRCKLVFTTRSRIVCGSMGVDHQFEVKLLLEDEAWDLFQKKVGEATLGRHVDIRRLAKEVAKTCHGLPLALNVIGETMASKTTVREWKQAIGDMSSSSSSSSSSSAIEIAGMDENILKVLKYSYDGLSGKYVKACFRYCALFPAASALKKVDLIDYWICEANNLGVNQSRQSAIGQGYRIINELVRSCLLRNVDSGQYVKMHTWVHKMASWIATASGSNKEKRVVHANDAELHQLPKVNDWTRVCRMLLMNTGLAKLSGGSPNCSRLTTLFLQNNRNLVHIAGDFFKNMPKLVVLNLSSTKLEKVPKQLSDLITLRLLDLSSTMIENLPDGLEKLEKLIHLNLERTSRLKSVVGISRVPLLRVLRLRSSKCLADLNTVNELKSMEHLEVVTIDTSSTTALEELLRHHKLANSVQRLTIVEANNLVLSATDGLIDLTIRNCSTLEVEIQRSSSSRSLRNSSFDNLSTVCISGCDGLKELTWLLFAPNLTVLELRGSNKLEEIINKEKAAAQQMQGDAPLQKLEKLDLSDLPMLKRIHWSALPFPCLRSIKC
ncbi:unnamed protein product [Eruca vesicaria subsp. sativa]|uniref:NB-ARC domain-containing protein n=1 Tax=Eruca vesicaria subsp. sativa TaxID=29727 RepID=A0ABC8M961_ERUVS|nr:unnamed protein product [Eruca vesicaria subsp. sativa]